MVEDKQLRLIHELREQGIDWETIHDTVGSTDNDRKLYYGFKIGLEQESDNGLIKNAKTLQTIRLSRKELGIERSINNEQIRDITLHRTFTNQVVDAIQTRYNDLKMSLPYESIKDPDMAHIFTVADFHYDGDTTYLEVIKRATQEIIKVVQEKNLKHIYLFELGDVIEGASLRTSQLMAVKSGMINQLIDVVDAYVKMISYLNEFTTITFVSVDSSNHTQLRNLGTKQNQLVEEDLMLLFNKMIETALPDLDFIHGDDIMINILGFNVFIAHGHLVKSKEKYLETLQADRNVLIDYGFFGHYHHQRTIDLHSAMGYDKKVFYVPALATKHSGYEKDKNLSSQAGVGYYVFEKGKGHIETRKLVI